MLTNVGGGGDGVVRCICLEAIVTSRPVVCREQRVVTSDACELVLASIVSAADTPCESCETLSAEGTLGFVI